MKFLHPLNTTAIALGIFCLSGMPGFAYGQDYDVTPYYGEDFPRNEEGFVIPADPYYDGFYKDPYKNDGDYDWMYYEDSPMRSAYDWLAYEDEENIHPDDELRANILRDLDLSQFVDENLIHISIDNGVATLSGIVEDRSAMVNAVEIAYDAGAWKVRNNLRLSEKGDRPWADMGDRELRAEIEDELSWSPFVNEENVTVRVQDGVATLYGGVENKGEIADAVENAYEAGAKRVKSRLKVNQDRS